eukprot:CAMPEP_0174266162 /NCGR_PEP_ID=MMETSP0439-20130205/29209_1 /TAXON_ID=0 /ORGANISM="Stereomyxa ramosa, Strain Chinc5" /LENGTH=422 /DNA_ID=CAMNT_0015352961 /DNA_START=49 /DNA_END=1317 /DNA_ORIENTATION=-
MKSTDSGLFESFGEDMMFLLEGTETFVPRTPPSMKGREALTSSVILRNEFYASIENYCECERSVNAALQELKEHVLTQLKRIRPKQWSKVQNDEFKMIRMSRAMTNFMFLCSSPSHPEVDQLLLRIYGIGTEIFFDREKEIESFIFMNQCGLGPELVSQFKNGRFEEYLNVHTITKAEMIEPVNSRKIGATLAKIHLLVTNEHDEKCSPDAIWTKLRAWFKIAKSRAEEHIDLISQSTVLTAIDFDHYKQEIDILEAELKKLKSPIVFCHNDMQYGNLLLRKEDNKIVFVDYEYADFYPRGYDFANHFQEWCYDYDGLTPYKIVPKDYPTKEQQMNFFEGYLAGIKELTSPEKLQQTIGGSEEEFLERLCYESQKFSLATHLFWGFWGIIQSTVSIIDFNYFEYAVQRLRRYDDTKDEILAL